MEDGGKRVDSIAPAAPRLREWDHRQQGRRDEPDTAAHLRHRAQRDPVKRDGVVAARGKRLPANEPHAAVSVATKKGPLVDWETLLTGISRGKTVLEYATNHTIFMQGQPADAVYFLLQGKVKLAVANRFER